MDVYSNGDDNGTGYSGRDRTGRKENGSYKTLNSKQLESDFYNALLLNAPTPRIECELYKIVINKYIPGDYISRHMDRELMLDCFMVSLRDTDDTLMTDTELYPDRKGWCKQLVDMFVPHWVPIVKNERYTVIYLFN